MIKVLIVEDSLTSRKTIKDSLEGDPEIKVVGEAAGGEEALEMLDTLEPDVITTDILMPGMDGLELTGKILDKKPKPIILLTSAIDESSLAMVYESLAIGALEVYEKPTFLDMGDRWKRGLRNRVRAAAKVDVAKLLSEYPDDKSSLGECVGCDISVVALGGSMGAFRPLLKIIENLGADNPVPVLVLMHMVGNLSRNLAEWFEDKTGLVTVNAVGGEAIHASPGVVFFAPPGKHLKVENGELVLEDSPTVHRRIPSIDVLFKSLSVEMGPDTVAVLLSNRGEDGVEGLKAVKDAGGLTICQDEESAPVFETGRLARDAKAVQEFLSPAKVAQRISGMLY